MLAAWPMPPGALLVVCQRLAGWCCWRSTSFTDLFAAALLDVAQLLPTTVLSHPAYTIHNTPTHTHTHGHRCYA